MIASGYSLHLYCDREEACVEYDGRSDAITKFGEFYAERPADAWAAARKAGWLVLQTRRVCLCPPCRAQGFAIDPKTGKIVDRRKE